jgi:hypothetical protein
MRCAVLSPLLLVLALLGSRAAHADDPPPMKPAAHAHFERGLDHFRHARYPDAIAELQAGFAIDPHPDFHFPLAQAHRLAGDCKKAIAEYERALDAMPSESRRIRARIDECRATLAEPEPERQRQPEPEPQPQPQRQPQPEPERPPEAPSRRPFYLDAIGDALAIGGLVSLGVGAGFFVAASRTEDAVTESDVFGLGLDIFDERSEKADRERRIGTVAVIAGGALVAGAIVRWILIDDTADTRVAAAIDGDGIVVVSGSF